MASIGKIGTAMKENLIYKPMKWLGDHKWQKKLNKGYQVNDANIIGAVGVTSILLKDGLGCYMYVTQSLNNEKIPEDKRKFVAALDLVNGILMMSLQFIMFKTISNKMFQAKMFDKLFGKYFDRKAAKGYAAALGGTDKFKGITGDKFHPALQNYKDTIGSAFSQITSLAAATIVAKRMLVPFIATPLAGKAKDWMCRNDKPVPVNEATKNSYDTEKTVDISTTDIKENKQELKNNTQIAHSKNLLDTYIKSHPQKEATKNSYGTEKTINVSTADVKENKQEQKNNHQIAHSTNLIDTYIKTQPQK